MTRLATPISRRAGPVSVNASVAWWVLIAAILATIAATSVVRRSGLRRRRLLQLDAPVRLASAGGKQAGARRRDPASQGTTRVATCASNPAGPATVNVPAVAGSEPIATILSGPAPRHAARVRGSADHCLRGSCGAAAKESPPVARERRPALRSSLPFDHESRMDGSRLRTARVGQRREGGFESRLTVTFDTHHASFVDRFEARELNLELPSRIGDRRARRSDDAHLGLEDAPRADELHARAHHGLCGRSHHPVQSRHRIASQHADQRECHQPPRVGIPSRCGWLSLFASRQQNLI